MTIELLRRTGDDELYGLIHTGLAADIPAPGVIDRFYWATDTRILYRDTGAAWVETTRAEAVTRLAELSERAHGSLTGVTPNQHHDRQHALDSAADHTGTITDAQHGVRTLANAHAHASLSGIGANDHHAAFTAADHTAIGDAAPHHARYTNGEADARIAIHAAIPAAHHAPSGWEHIDTQILAASAPSIDFPGLSLAYNAFRITAFIKRQIMGVPLSTGMRFNDDAGANYDLVGLVGDGVAATSGSLAGSNYAVMGIFDDTHYGIAFCYIQNREAAIEKEWLCFGGLGSSVIMNISGRWNNTTAKITKISLVAVVLNLLAGTQVTLEGCRFT